MEAPPGRRDLRWALALLVLAAARFSPAGTSASPPGGMHPLAPAFSLDRRLADLRPALVEARRKLSDSRCQEILTDFTDSSGHSLAASLESTGQGLPAYLEWVVFYDGSASSPCTDRQVLAWTTPGSRAVSICRGQFASLQRSRAGDAANILIHETLHTLGLGEGPPDAREITARVAARCGR